MHKVKPGNVYQYPGAERGFFIAIAVIEPPEGAEGVQQVFGIEIGTDPGEEVAILSWRNSSHLGNSHRGAPQWKCLSGVGVEDHPDHKLFYTSAGMALARLEERAEKGRVMSRIGTPADDSNVMKTLASTVTEVHGKTMTGSGRPLAFSFRNTDQHFGMDGLREVAAAIEAAQK